MSARDEVWLQAVNEHLTLSAEDVVELRARTGDVLFERAIDAMLTLPDDEAPLGHA